MDKPNTFDDYLHQRQNIDEENIQRIKAYLLLKLQKAKELKRPNVIVNAKNLMAEMNLKAPAVVFAKAMLEVKKPTDEILFGNASKPGSTLTIQYLL